MAISSVFHRSFLSGDKPLLTLDDEFLRHYTKVMLKSDASDRVWKVKLEGNRLAGGWEEFAAAHNFSDGDVLVFRHDGDEVFHVAVSSRSSSSDVHHASRRCTEVDGESDVEDDDVDDGAGYSCVLRARVTPYSLNRDRLDLCKDFKVMSFNKHKKPCEIYLANKQGRKWTLILSRNITSGAFYIRRGWTNFCSANGLRQGDFCNFKLSESGERPVLLLCSQESGNGHEDKDEECSEEDAVKICSVGGCSKENNNTPSRFLTLEYTPNRFKNGQLYISPGLLRESGIKKSGEITLVDNDGRKWPSYLHMVGQKGGEWFYIRKGWREMCKANGVKVNDSFVLELIWEDANPIFKFHSKIENKGKGKIITFKKRALRARTVEKTQGVAIDGERGSKRGRARVSNKSNTNSRKLQRTQPESCSVSDQVANVKRSIQDTLNTIRHFNADLEIREKNLEASLLEVDSLGERILGISKILNNNLV